MPFGFDGKTFSSNKNYNKSSTLDKVENGSYWCSLDYIGMKEIEDGSKFTVKFTIQEDENNNTKEAGKTIWFSQKFQPDDENTKKIYAQGMAIQKALSKLLGDDNFEITSDAIVEEAISSIIENKANVIYLVQKGTNAMGRDKIDILQGSTLE